MDLSIDAKEMVNILAAAYDMDDVHKLLLSFVKTFLLIPTEGEGDLNPRTSVVMSLCMTILSDALGPKDAASAFRVMADSIDEQVREGFN